MALADRVAALEAALEAGVLEVQEDGRTVRYPSPDAITRALAALYAQRTAAATGWAWALTKLKPPGTV